jgi:hypothetical protein
MRMRLWSNRMEINLSSQIKLFLRILHLRSLGF